MLNCDVNVVGNIATVTISQPTFGVSNGFNLENLMTRLDRLTPNGVIFDVSSLKKIPQATLGGLVEAFIRLDQARLFRPSGMALALCGVPEKTLKQILENGLDRLLPIFASIPDALADQSFKSMRLRGVRSVVLCASQGARLAPLTGPTPVGMLDYLGRPMIARVMEHA